MVMNFADALNVKSEEIERPPLMPVGTYRWIVEKIPSQDTIADGRYDVCDFTLKCMGAEDDVDEEDLAKFGDVTKVRRRLRFMFNKEDEAEFGRSLFRLKQFLTETLGIEEGNKSLKEMLNESVNMPLKADIRWRADKNDPEKQYDEIGRTAPIE